MGTSTATTTIGTATTAAPNASRIGEVRPPLVFGAPAKPKRPIAWVAIGAAMVVLGALAGLMLVVGGDKRTPALITSRPLVAGKPVTIEDFRIVRVATVDGVTPIAADSVDGLIGRLPTGPIPTGVIVADAMFSDQVALAAGESVVGAALPPGAVPVAGLHPGDTVDVIITGSNSAASPGQAAIIGRAVVWAIEPLGTGASATGDLWVSLRTPTQTVAAIAQAAQDKSLRLALVGAGVDAGVAG